MCFNFCKFQLNAGAGSGAEQFILQGLLRCGGELGQGAAGLGWAEHLPIPVSPGGHHHVRVLFLAGSRGCSEQWRGSAGMCWERKGLLAAAGPLLPAKPVRDWSGSGLRLFHKRKFLPGTGFLQSRPAAPPPPRDRAVLPGPRWTSADVPWPPSPSRFPLAAVPQYPTAAGPWLMAPSQHSLAQCPLAGLGFGAAAPGCCVGSRRWGYRSNLFLLPKKIYICKPSRGGTLSHPGCFL